MFTGFQYLPAPLKWVALQFIIGHSDLVYCILVNDCSYCINIGCRREMIAQWVKMILLVACKVSWWLHCKPIPVMKTGFSLCTFPSRENPVFITGIPANENRFFPVWKYYTGKTLFWPCTGPVRDCSVRHQKVWFCWCERRSRCKTCNIWIHAEWFNWELNKFARSERSLKFECKGGLIP